MVEGLNKFFFTNIALINIYPHAFFGDVFPDVTHSSVSTFRALARK